MKRAIGPAVAVALLAAAASIPAAPPKPTAAGPSSADVAATPRPTTAADPLATARELLAIPPRPARPALPPSSLPLTLIEGERIAFLGNATAERMNLFGHFETLLHERFPEQRLVVRNFGWPADEVGTRQRPTDYTRLDDPLSAFGADTLLLFFGFNESFAGPGGIEKFKADYGKLLDDLAAKYPRDDTKAPPRFVIVSPIAVEPSDDPLLPDASAQNANLALYRDAAREIASARGIAFVDLLSPSLEAFTAKPGLQFTINGCHVNDSGDRLLGETLDRSLFGPSASNRLGKDRLERLRAAVNDKSWVHLQDYRMVNGWYVYGGRRTWDTETFPREYVKLRGMAAVRDRRVWDIAAGREVPPIPDDSATGALFTPQTRFGEPRQAYSENAEGGPVIKSPEEFLKTCTVPEGFEIRLFADERQFPEIANPVQLGFDSKGRLWVSTMPSYPQWQPGSPRPADKLVILEDVDRDGRADRSTIFYDKLHCPTGFQFFDGGVLVMDQPRMLWLKDSDGDDRADVVVHVLDGWATEDTHHTAGAFETSHGGLLHALEGISMSTTLETPWGPFRNFGTAGCYVLDPRTWKIRHFKTPGYGNPWCYVFNEWGQGVCGDGTTAAQHWDTPLSGMQYPGRKGMSPVFDTEGMRPVVGSEYLRTRQFPDDVQDQFVYACVINTNGIPRWRISDDGAGYHGERVRRELPGIPDPAKPDERPKPTVRPFDLLKSSDKHFRPVDPQIGPDGCLWFGDWANPLIGHMQYSQRDPNRDHAHGRIYRLVCTERPLVEPETQFGRPAAELLSQLSSPEWRTRDRARTEFRSRPRDSVLPAAAEWLAGKAADPAYDRLRTELLWLQQGFHAVEPKLLEQALAAKTPDARAAATRVLADERDRIPSAEKLLVKQSTDPHPRVRVEAVRGLSFFATEESMGAVVAAANVTPEDRYVAYTCDAALAAHVGVWRAAHEKGALAAKGSPAAVILDGVLGFERKAAEVQPHLAVLVSREPKTDEQRNKAMQAIVDIKGGNPENGRHVFRRICATCHKVNSEGAELGPEMTKVATRLSPYKLVESIVEPNADIDEKYLSTLVVTDDGRTVTGLLVSETPEQVVIYDGRERRTIPTAAIEERAKLRQSSMPDGLAATLSPNEFLDVVEYLKGLK